MSFIETESQPINIKDLVLEDPEKASDKSFDIERDMKTEDWVSLENRWERSEYFIIFSKFELAYWSKVLGRPHELPSDITDYDAIEKWESANYQLSQYEYLMVLVYRAGLGIKGNINYEKLSPYTREFNDSVKDRDWHTARKQELICNMLVAGVAPESKSLIDYEDFNKIPENEDASYVNHAKLMKLIGLTPILPSDFWGKAKGDLQRNRKYGYSAFRLLADLAIISADKIVINDDGIHLINEKKYTLNPETPPLPERREF